MRCIAMSWIKGIYCHRMAGYVCMRERKREREREREREGERERHQNSMLLMAV